MDKFSHCDLHNETFRYTKGCYECALEEIDRLKSDLRDTSIALRTAIESIQAHKAELAEYAGGVEVEGIVRVYDNEVHIESDVRDWPVGHGVEIGASVTVLMRAKG